MKNVPLQGMKRSVTTLRGGTLGYAEIVAVKVQNKFISLKRKLLCLFCTFFFFFVFQNYDTICRNYWALFIISLIYEAQNFSKLLAFTHFILFLFCCIW